MRFLFVGGPGRSGTSFVARQLGMHPQIASFPDIELKLITEKGGLLDLHHSLVEHYSPNRAGVADRQFQGLTRALWGGQFGQPPLSTQVDEAVWSGVINRFLDSFAPSGFPEPQTAQRFFAEARILLGDIAALAASVGAGSTGKRLFLEKTPHCLLSAGFISKIVPEPIYLHVMRDPRAIAYSLRRMRWGPDTLQACCAWVGSYCRAWRACVNQNNAAEQSIRHVFIEDIAVAPDHAASEIAEWFGLVERPDMFRGSSLAVLNGWQSNCAPEELDLLQRELQSAATELGYDAEDIGARAGTSALSEAVA